MATTTINGVLRKINGIKERPDLDINRILFYKKEEKQYAMVFKDDVLIDEVETEEGVRDIEQSPTNDIILDIEGLAFQKLSSGHFDEGSVGGIYSDNLAGSTYTILNHPNYS